MHRSRILLFLLILVLPISATAYTVKPGDTLARIARQELGNADRWKEIAKLNGIADPGKLRVGQELRIPGAEIDTAHVLTDAPAAAPARLTPIELFPQELRIVSASGRGQISSRGRARDAALGEQIFPPDNLFISEDARFVLSGSGGERLVMEEAASAAFDVRSVSMEQRDLRLRIDRGLLRAAIPAAQIASTYEVALPTGALRTRGADFEVRVLDPSRAALSVFDGQVDAVLPHGSMKIEAGNAAILDTLRPPPPPVPLPRGPSVNLQKAPNVAIVAAAAQEGDTVDIEVYSDPDRLLRFARRRLSGDSFGVAITRFRLPAGNYWFAAQSVAPDGRRSRITFEGPLPISGEN